MEEGIKERCEILEKTKRVFPLVKENIDDKTIIGAESITDVYMWIDASYKVHSNMISHTGHGFLQGQASVQRLNTKISTEAELVGVSEYLP